MIHGPSTPVAWLIAAFLLAPLQACRAPTPAAGPELVAELERARQHAARGECLEALAAFERARSLEPRSARAAIEAGDHLASLHLPAQALQAWEEAARIERADPEPHVRRARLERRYERWPEARRSVDAALARDPEHVPANLELARIALRGNQLDLADAALERARAAGERGADAVLLQAAVLRRRGNLIEAGALLRQLLATSPDHREALLELAQVERESDRFRDSLELFERVEAGGSPLPASAAYELARLHFRAGRGIEGTRWQQRHLEANVREVSLRDLRFNLWDQPGSFDLRRTLGQKLLDSGENRESEAVFCGSAFLAPPDPGPWIGVALAALQGGRKDSARRAIEEALRRPPHEPRMLIRLSALLRAIGEAGRAEELARLAGQASPSDLASPGPAR